jgi:hypothetical protein
MNMRKRYIIMFVSTLIIGIAIGFLASNYYLHKKGNRLIVEPTKEYFREKAIRLLKLDETQIKQFESTLTKFSDKAYNIEKENNVKMYNTLDSLYIELKPALTPEQTERFEKRLSKIKSVISK